MKTLFVVYIALLVLAMSACQKSNQDATAPGITTDCLYNPYACNQGLYQQSPGFVPYSTSNYYYGGGSNYGGYYGGTYNPFGYGNNSAYLCNCPNGSLPTYNNYSGLGCVQSSYISGSFYASYGYSANNNQWTNIPQISNQVGYTNNGCYNGVVQSCVVTDPRTCQLGYTCRSSDASSYLGVCVSNNSNQNPGQTLR
jgi:hypothetical protein